MTAEVKQEWGTPEQRSLRWEGPFDPGQAWEIKLEEGVQRGIIPPSANIGRNAPSRFQDPNTQRGAAQLQSSGVPLSTVSRKRPGGYLESPNVGKRYLISREEPEEALITGEGGLDTRIFRKVVKKYDENNNLIDIVDEFKIVPELNLEHPWFQFRAPPAAVATIKTEEPIPTRTALDLSNVIRDANRTEENLASSSIDLTATVTDCDIMEHDLANVGNLPATVKTEVQVKAERIKTASKKTKAKVKSVKIKQEENQEEMARLQKVVSQHEKIVRDYDAAYAEKKAELQQIEAANAQLRAQIAENQRNFEFLEAQQRAQQISTVEAQQRASELRKDGDIMQNLGLQLQAKYDAQREEMANLLSIHNSEQARFTALAHDMQAQIDQLVREQQQIMAAGQQLQQEKNLIEQQKDGLAVQVQQLLQQLQTATAPVFVNPAPIIVAPTPAPTPRPLPPTPTLPPAPVPGTIYLFVLTY